MTTRKNGDHAYELRTETIRYAPRGWISKLRFLGPGFILSASIVGSGELIATTTLGARAGFTALWVIILSCLVKVAVQLEFGKHTITTGETAMQIFDKLPGFRIGKSGWAVWFIFLLLLLKFVQLGGMIGSAAIVLSLLAPSVPVLVWLLVCALAVSLLIFGGFYGVIEKLSLLMVALFTVLTLLAVGALEYTGYDISWGDIASGLTLHLDSGMLAVAVGAFGLTGVASDEIIAYNYWCIEKGYASYTGRREDTDAWRERASGWIDVMYLDAIVAMIIYTAVTAAFYLLGAAILHQRGEIPGGNELIGTIALIYTESLGEGVRTAYLVGAFFVLFSSLFATLAAWTRIYPDVFARLGWIDFHKARRRVIAWLAWIVPIVWVLSYLFLNVPVAMILFGGAVGSIMLFVIAFTAIDIRYRRSSEFTADPIYNVAFWVSVISIFAVGVYGFSSLFQSL